MKIDHYDDRQLVADTWRKYAGPASEDQQSVT